MSSSRPTSSGSARITRAFSDSSARTSRPRLPLPRPSWPRSPCSDSPISPRVAARVLASPWRRRITRLFADRDEGTSSDCASRSKRASRLRRTEQDQAVAAAVGKDLDGGGALPGGRGDAAIEHLGDFRDPGMAHVVDAVVMFAGPVEAAHDRLDALDVGAAVADDQRVGRRYGGQMAMGRDQRPDHRDQFRHRGLLRLDHPRLQAARPIADGLLRGVLACLHVRHDTRLVALRQHRVAVGGEHRKE